jgi:hypothetical protein
VHQPDGLHTPKTLGPLKSSASAAHTLSLSGRRHTKVLMLVHCAVRACRVHDLKDGTTSAYERTIQHPILSSATPNAALLAASSPEPGVRLTRQGRTGVQIEDPPALTTPNFHLSTPAHMPMRLRLCAGAFA